MKFWFLHCKCKVFCLWWAFNGPSGHFFAISKQVYQYNVTLQSIVLSLDVRKITNLNKLEDLTQQTIKSKIVSKFILQLVSSFLNEADMQPLNSHQNPPEKNCCKSKIFKLSSALLGLVYFSLMTLSPCGTTIVSIEREILRFYVFRSLSENAFMRLYFYYMYKY